MTGAEQHETISQLNEYKKRWNTAWHRTLPPYWDSITVNVSVDHYHMKRVNTQSPPSIEKVDRGLDKTVFAATNTKSWYIISLFSHNAVHVPDQNFWSLYIFTNKIFSRDQKKLAKFITLKSKVKTKDQLLRCFYFLCKMHISYCSFSCQ